MSSPHFGVAPAAGAAAPAGSAAQLQKRAAGKTGTAKGAAAARPQGKSEAKGAIKRTGDAEASVVCAQNQPITFGQTINGTLAAGDCLNPIEGDGSKVDEYTFTGSAGQQIAVSMSATFDTFLYLLNQNGSVIAVNDDIDPNVTTNSRIPPTGFFTLPSNGTYSILANSFRPEDGGPYTLTLSSGNNCNLTPIAFGETKTGTLNSGDCTNPIDQDGTPVDYYTFSGTAGQQIAVTLAATSGNLDPYLYLLTPSGDLLADDDNGGGGTSARIPTGAGFGRLPVTGTYTIVVNTVLTTQSGNYSLTLTKAATDCASVPLTIGSTVNGSLANGDCRLLEDSSFIDAYTFTGAANGQVVITMTSSTAGLVPVVFLLAPTGDVLAIDVNTDGDNTARIPNTSGTFTLPATGSYTVLANSFAANQTGNYTLRVVDSSACTATLTTTSREVNGGGGAFSFNFTTQPGCTATATSNSGFINVTSTTVDANGTGTVNYMVTTNQTNAPRTGTITVLGQTFTVTQGAACTFAVYPRVRPFTSEASTSGRFTVITQPGCAWSVSTNTPWITITQGTNSSTGNGTVRYTVAANTTNATRTGTITLSGPVGSPSHTVTQTSAGTTPQIQFSGNGEFTVNENDASRSATITVTRSGDTAGAATIDYATLDNTEAVPCDPNIKRPDGSLFPQGTAYARCDYASTIDTLTFLPGETTKTFSIPLIDDVFQENTETFAIRLFNPQGATLGTIASGLVRLQSDDLAMPTTNPINQIPFFVRQHYLDFLDREPEANEPWSAVLRNCPQNIFSGPEVNSNCDRIAVSGAFFGSPEYRIKGLFVFLHYKAAFGTANNPLYVPEYVEFVADSRRVSGTTAEEVIAKRLDFSEDFLARTSVANIFTNTTNAEFVDRILSNLGIALTNPDPVSGETRTSLVNGLNNGTRTRAQVLRIIVESTEAIAAHFNRAFVAIQYYGYLRRTPEPLGYEQNLNELNRTNDSRRLINGFLNSIEYRLRFGANTTNP